MRVVIVGATGNVGTSLVEALGHDEQITSVLGLARRRPAWDPPTVEWREADIRRDELTGHLANADVVVHLAWMIQPAREPMATWQANVDGTRRVLDAVQRAGVDLVTVYNEAGARFGDRGADPD